MNKKRRAALMKVAATLAQAYADIETLRDEEQDAYDNLPESLQSGENGDTMSSAIDDMDSAISEVESARDTLFDLANG